MTFKAGYKRAPESIAATCATLHAQAVERNAGNPLGACPRCGDVNLVKWGIERQGRFPRQRYRCRNWHITAEPREYPLGQKFQSEPWKLLKAMHLMKSGKKSLQQIAKAVELDRYTIYKLHNHLGRPFSCVCGRPLGHHGHCRHRFYNSLALINQMDAISAMRKASRPEPDGWKLAEKKLKQAIKKLKEMEDAG